MNWFPKHGKSMDTFRTAVKAAMGTASNPVTPLSSTPVVQPTSVSGDKTIWDFLKGKGLNDFAVAGLMGNLFAESGLRSNNLQNAYESKLGYTDETYTAAVDSGKYTNFVNDGAGYGLAQWTYYSRKENLYQYAKLGCKSIGDLQTQLEFLWRELQGYTAVMNVLKCATTVRQASDVVLLQFERPADQSVTVQTKRASYGQGYYDKYAGKVAVPVPPTTQSAEYRVRVTTDALNYRKGPGTNYPVSGTIKDRGIYTIAGESDGPGAKKWGKLKSGAGWVSLDYCQRM